MKKKVILSVVCIVLIIAAAVCFLPRSTRISQTVTAAKLDQDGKENSTVEITIRGWKLDYLFQDPRLILSIDPFGPYVWFDADDWVNRPTGFIMIYPGSDFWFTTYSAGNDATDDIDCFYLFFSPDLSRCARIDYHNKNCYVFSTNSDCSTLELYEYFKTLFPKGHDAKA